MVSAFVGGLLIGMAALLLYATAGRIAGISGILFGSLWQPAAERGWRGLFLVGLVGGGWLAVLAGLGAVAAPAPASSAGLLLLALAGLLVGYGTRLGNGCTSGHGVCGLARLSRRSLAATAAFMLVGMLVATLLRPLLPGVTP